MVAILESTILGVDEVSQLAWVVLNSRRWGVLISDGRGRETGTEEVGTEAGYWWCSREPLELLGCRTSLFASKQ